MATFAFRGRVDKLEIARGHDGFLRGAPDPVVLFAVYATSGSEALLLGRSVHRFRPLPTFPSEVDPDEKSLPSCVLEASGGFAFVVLALALEEDGGGDVQRMFGVLERPAALSVWAAERADVEPHAIAAVGARWPGPAVVELCINGAAAGSTCRSDKWIGAVCWGMAPEPGTAPRSHRLHFLSTDGRNDWTLLVSLAVTSDSRNVAPSG